MKDFTRSLYPAIAISLMLLSYGTARASENGRSAYAGGAGSPYIGRFPTIPGVFMLEQTNYSSSNEMYGDNGKPQPTPFHSSAYSQTTRLLVGYPFHLLGADLASQLVFPYVHVSSNVAGVHSGGSGFGGLTISPLVMTWHVPYGLHVTAGFDWAPDSGDYDPNSASPGTGYSTYMPIIALRYEPSRENGPLLAISNRLLINSTNHTTHYNSGDSYIAEFEAGWNFEDVQVGVLGAYQTQYEDDTVYGEKVGPNGNRLEQLRLGPTISYKTNIFGPPVTFNLNYQEGVDAQNAGKSDNVWFNVALPLYVPSMMDH